jgi:hypothetical protein
MDTALYSAGLVPARILPVKKLVPESEETMKFINRIFVVLALPLVLLSLALPRTVEAQQNWKATLGAQNKDMGKQVIAFLPNELWIHMNDSITWTSAAGDIHTVSFFIAGQP